MQKKTKNRKFKAKEVLLSNLNLKKTSRYVPNGKQAFLMSRSRFSPQPLAITQSNTGIFLQAFRAPPSACGPLRPACFIAYLLISQYVLRLP